MKNTAISKSVNVMVPELDRSDFMQFAAEYKSNPENYGRVSIYDALKTNCNAYYAWRLLGISYEAIAKKINETSWKDKKEKLTGERLRRIMGNWRARNYYNAAKIAVYVQHVDASLVGGIEASLRIKKQAPRKQDQAGKVAVQAAPVPKAVVPAAPAVVAKPASGPVGGVGAAQPGTAPKAFTSVQQTGKVS